MAARAPAQGRAERQDMHAQGAEEKAEPKTPGGRAEGPCGFLGALPLTESSWANRRFCQPPTKLGPFLFFQGGVP